jgi:hypothetical protein
MFSIDPLNYAIKANSNTPDNPETYVCIPHLHVCHSLAEQPIIVSRQRACPSASDGAYVPHLGL